MQTLPFLGRSALWLALTALAASGCDDGGDGSGGDGGSSGTPSSGGQGGGGDGGSSGTPSSGGGGQGSGADCDGVTCAADEYCAFVPCKFGRLDYGFLCLERPTSCPSGGVQVCGQDGKIYENTCEAAKVGVDIDPSFGCDAPAGTPTCGAEICDAATQYCFSQWWDCDLGGPPTCQPLPPSCATPPADCGCFEGDSGPCDADMLSCSVSDGLLDVYCDL